MGRESLDIGARIAGRYIVTRVIARGSMGMILGVLDKAHNKKRALKVLSEGVSTRNPARVQRFLRETSLMMGLRGRHVVHVHDAGFIGSGTPYLVMDRLSGATLQDVLDEGRSLTVSAAADVIIQACHGLDEAHKLGIVHRDLKPSNLFLDRRHGVKVIDFGIAKCLRADAANGTAITRTGMSLGTPSFMSPEQVRDARCVDPRSDIWALGVILYCAVSGKRPFARKRMGQELSAVLEEGYTSLGKLGIPGTRNIDPIIARCLAKDPAQRFQSVTELAAALAPFASHHSTELARQILRQPLPDPPSYPAELESSDSVRMARLPTGPVVVRTLPEGLRMGGILLGMVLSAVLMLSWPTLHARFYNMGRDAADVVSTVVMGAR